MNTKKYKKRKRRFQKFTLAILLFLTVFWLAPKIISTASDIVYTVFNSSSDLTTKYKAATPMKLNNHEVKNKLYSLSQKYPEFKTIYKNISDYPESLLVSLCNTPEMIDFVKEYPNADSKPHGNITEKELSEGIPLLIQWDKCWGYASYGNSDIGISGCAPTCLSMVISGLTDNRNITPYKVAKFAEKNGYYIEGTGTSWNIMTEGVSSFGITGIEIPLSKNSIFSHLENNEPIICSMRPGDFTTAGHFIVLTKTENGQIKVNDPNSRSRSKIWSYETLEKQIKNLWAFSKS